MIVPFGLSIAYLVWIRIRSNLAKISDKRRFINFVEYTFAVLWFADWIMTVGVIAVNSLYYSPGPNGGQVSILGIWSLTIPHASVAIFMLGWAIFYVVRSTSTSSLKLLFRAAIPR